jgi:hypothetical protein
MASELVLPIVAGKLYTYGASAYRKPKYSFVKPEVLPMIVALSSRTVAEARLTGLAPTSREIQERRIDMRLNDGNTESIIGKLRGLGL